MDGISVRAVEASSGRGVVFTARPGEPLLDQLEAACPFAVPSACQVGLCGACAVRVLAGAEHLDAAAFDAFGQEPPGPGRALACVSGVRSSGARPRRLELRLGPEPAPSTDPGVL